MMMRFNDNQRTIEPFHEIMALFVLRKLILQTRMRSHPVGLGVWCLVGLFVYFHASCVRTAKALVRLRGWAGSPDPPLVACVISTIISWAGSIFYHSLKTHLIGTVYVVKSPLLGDSNEYPQYIDLMRKIIRTISANYHQILTLSVSLVSLKRHKLLLSCRELGMIIPNVRHLIQILKDFT